MLKNMCDKHLFLISLNVIFLPLLLFATFFFWFSLPSSAGLENNALGIKIYANPNNYSAMRWYNNEFPEGSPKRGTPATLSIKIDGYEGISDGRTAYVNVGNVKGANTYSNIYTLGFSDKADKKTMQVHANMLEHWTFNINLIEALDYGTCSIATEACLIDADCSSTYECRNSKCHLPIVEENNFTCWRDKNCDPETTGLYCSGEKAEITRRTKRLADLADIKIMIMDYVAKGNEFPDFSAGSYLPGITISTWDSWNITDTSLARLIQVGSLPLDPINTMGHCAGFDLETCWDDVLPSNFGGTINSGRVTGPAGSFFYGYNVEDNSVYSFSDDETIVCPLDGTDCFSL